MWLSPRTLPDRSAINSTGGVEQFGYDRGRTRDELIGSSQPGRRADDWLFPSRSRHGDHITTRQYARLVDRWVQLVDLQPGAYGTHSLRRTKVALVYKKTGNLRACQLLLGHTKLESTVRYLGVELDDALALSEALEI